MSGFLDNLCAESRLRCREARQLRPLEGVVELAEALPRPPLMKVSDNGFDIIAEVKKTSPSAGRLSSENDAALIDRALVYANAGAAAVSVLTEPTRFGGELSHLEVIAAALRPLNVPAMRKDFLVDVYQVWEAAAAGAGGVLVIVRVLDDATILQMLDAAARTGMFVLLEAFDVDDLRRVQPFLNGHDNVLVGLNSRDLETLAVDTSRFAALAAAFPRDCLRVAESGIATAADARAVADAGYRFALVGTALMRAGDPAELIAGMLAAAR